MKCQPFLMINKTLRQDPSSPYKWVLVSGIRLWLSRENEAEVCGMDRFQSMMS